MEKLKETLSNYTWMPILLTIGFIGWVCQIDFLTVPLLCVYVGLLLTFCDDIRNLYSVAFAVPFFINTIEGFIDYVILGVGILFFLIGLTIFLIRHLAIRKTPVKKGKLFWGMVVCLIAYLIGGIWGYFNILNAIIITAMTLASYFLYWVAINFTTNLKEYLNGLFICIGVVLSLQLLISYVMVDEPFLSAIQSKNVIWIGLQNINVVAIYFMLAMLSTFQIAVKHKFDYLITLGGMCFAGLTYFTYSRMGILICCILMLIAVIYIFVKSEHKPIFSFIGIVCVFIIQFLFIKYFDDICKLFSHYSKLGFKGNGRDTLWPWCWEKFVDNPIFGVGFTSTDPVPGLISTESIILAHNSFLQYLVSLGIVGTLLMGYYFFSKYKILTRNFNEFKFFNLLLILSIALSGITDQSPTMDIFMICISLILVANAELDSENTPVATNTISTTSQDTTVHPSSTETSPQSSKNSTLSNKTSRTTKPKTKTSKKDTTN